MTPTSPLSRPARPVAIDAILALLRTADRVRTRLEEVVAAYDITLQQYNVLRILRGAAGEPLPTLEIGNRMVERSPGITRLLDRLEAKGLVARRRCTEDRRQVLCTITPEGLDLLATMDEPVLAADLAVMAALDEPEQQRLTDLLVRVCAAQEAPGC